MPYNSNSRRNADIRAWAKYEGIELGERGRIPQSIIDEYDQVKGAADSVSLTWEDEEETVAPPKSERPPKLEPRDSVPGGPKVDTSKPPDEETKEQAPNVGKRKFGFGLFGKKDSQTDKQPIRPKVVHKRVSLAPIGSQVWAMAGMGLQMSGKDIPVGRVLEFQAPAAGPILDAAIKGTFLDKALQPLARSGAKGQALGALVMPPLLVAVIERNPASYNALAPILKVCIYQYMVEMAPVLKAQQRKEREIAEVMGDAGIDVDSIIGAIFAPVPQHEPASNGSHVGASV